MIELFSLQRFQNIESVFFPLGYPQKVRPLRRKSVIEGGKCRMWLSCGKFAELHSSSILLFVQLADEKIQLLLLSNSPLLSI